MEKELSERNIVFMFPGVGSQYFKMGEELYTNFDVARETFEEASDALNIDFYKLCFEEKDGRLDLLEYAKPSLVCLSTAIYKVYMQKVGIVPKYLMGYSLGEYSALCCAGVLKLKDALDIVRKRAAIVNEVASRQKGTMAWVINTKKSVVEELCRETYKSGFKIYISSYDSNEKLSVSGSMEGIRSFAKKIEDVGGMVIPIKMSGPFHSPMMKDAADELKEILIGYDFSSPQYSILANRNASVYSGYKEEIIENLSMQLCEPILWDKSLEFVIDSGVDTAIELGPKSVLKYLTETSTNKVKAYSIEKIAQINQLLSDIVVSQDEYISIIKKSLGVIVSTKNSCTDKEVYESSVVRPYKRILGLYEKYEKSTKDCNIEEVKEVLGLVRLVLQTKGLHDSEINKKICKLLNYKQLTLEHI